MRALLFVILILIQSTAHCFDSDAPAPSSKFYIVMPLIPLKMGQHSMVFGYGYLGNYRLMGIMPGDRRTKSENFVSVHKRTGDILKETREPNAPILFYRYSF